MWSSGIAQITRLLQAGTILLSCIILAGCGPGAEIGPNSPLPLSFAPPTSFDSRGSNLGPIALADFNGDGKLDIAVTYFFSNTVSIFLNDGNGVFHEPVQTNLQVPGGIV